MAILYNFRLKKRFSACKSIFTTATFIVSAVLLINLSVKAQTRDSSSPGISLEEYKYLKTIKVNNLEDDTYIKHNDAYILDREKKPFVFKFSDGVERRIYLYKVLNHTDRKDLALLAIYHTPANNNSINVCIPNTESDKNIWNLYIDDLKDQGEAETGFLSCMSFVLSKELSTFTSTDLASNVTSTDDDYDFCFPAGSLISLANGEQKAIENIERGDMILSYNSRSGLTEPIQVKLLKIHSQEANKGLTISKIILAPVELLTASNNSNPYFELSELEATGNHPVHTKRGKVEVKDLKGGDILTRFDSSTDTFNEFKVTTVIKDFRAVEKVYNLEVEGDNFLVNKVVVLEK